jgi:hypothetical protein
MQSSRIGNCNNMMLTSSGSWYQDSSTTPPNTWYHLATMLSGTTGRIYVNGAQTATMNQMYVPGNFTRTSTFGTYYNGVFSQVAIDEIKFYNRALSAAEVLTDAQMIGPIA